MTPLAAWYRGPFMALFRSDFRTAVSVLNHMLNDAALARARTLAGGHRQYGARIEEHHLDAYRTELDVTGAGARRTYVGGEHAWLWYRGTGVGPFPCMSALQALEQVCDQLVKADVPLTTLVTILLEDCENLAMVGLVVGLLVRHLERAGRLLDRYLTEPVIWHLEFARLVHETSGLTAADDGLTAPERRRWSLREAALTTVEAGLQIQSTPPQDVVEALQARDVETARAQEAIRLSVRYYINPKNGMDDAVEAGELVSDLASAAGRSSGSRSAALFRPPPGLRTRPGGSSPASSSSTPLRTVVSLTRAAPTPP